MAYVVSNFITALHNLEDIARRDNVQDFHIIERTIPMHTAHDVFLSTAVYYGAAALIADMRNADTGRGRYAWSARTALLAANLHSTKLQRTVAALQRADDPCDCSELWRFAQKNNRDDILHALGF